MKAIPKELKMVLNRSVWLYLAVVLVFVWAVNDKQAVKERGRYLLGIFYNEDLKNYKDGIVYFDYLVHHKPPTAHYYFLLGYSYAQTEDYRRAVHYLEEAVRLAPNDKGYPPYLDVAKAKLADRHANVEFPTGQIMIPVETGP
jgi:tetratricopeptide (TPR) repeat protein